jgi:hypothetical protein
VGEGGVGRKVKTRAVCGWDDQDSVRVGGWYEMRCDGVPAQGTARGSARGQDATQQPVLTLSARRRARAT